MDPQKRNAMIKEAFEIHRDDVGHIPLHQQFLAWGVADTVAEVKLRPQDDVDLRYVIMNSPAADASVRPASRGGDAPRQ